MLPHMHHRIHLVYHVCIVCYEIGDTVMLLVGQRTCDLQVMGLSPGRLPLRSGLRQYLYLCHQAV